MRLDNQIRRIKIFLLLIGLLILVFEECGCEAFVKKFRRKPKKEEQAQEEMVFVPQEYPSLFVNKEEAYRQYFLYWKGWQDELINALLSRTSLKKQLSCIDEAIKNLLQLKTILAEEKVKPLDAYIAELNALRNNIEQDPYSNNTTQNRYSAEKIKRNILRDFSYHKVKNNLK